jgi:hypothetical protein
LGNSEIFASRPGSGSRKVKARRLIHRVSLSHSMQDHTYFSIIATARENSSHTSVFRNYAKLQAAQEEYTTSFGGPLNTPIGPSFGFEQLNASTLESIGAYGLLDRTNISIVEYLIETDYFPAVDTQPYPAFPNQSYISLTAAVIADAPVINPNVSLPVRGNLATYSSALRHGLVPRIVR